MYSRFFTLTIIFITTLGLWAIPGSLVAAAQTSKPSFYKDVLPILEAHCQVCHRPGEIGPMPLITYGQARPWAEAIRQQVVLRKMPPWFADPRYGHFSNDPSLTPAEIAAVSKWAETGAPAGDPKDAPPPRKFATGWNIGCPDLVLRMPRAFHLPASGTIEYQYIVIPTGFRKDKWVTAAEVRPSNRSVVHHAVVYIREPESSWLRDAKPGIPYSIPADDPRHGTLKTTSDILLVYAPGHVPEPLRPDDAKLIPAGSDLVLQVHYTPNGKLSADQSEIGLVFAKNPVKARVLTLQMDVDRFVIPPGHPHFRVAVEGTLPNAATLLSFFPHMHYRGASFEYHYIHPDGTDEILLRVNPYRFHWQLTYQLAEPRLLPAGARLLWVAYYDNSKNNPENPDPDSAVYAGEQSWEEMMVGFFDVAVPPGIDKRQFFIRPRRKSAIEVINGREASAVVAL